MSRHPNGLGAVQPDHQERDGESRRGARRGGNEREVMYFAYDRLGMPLLHADLMRFPKGQQRLQRLRTLVMEGLMTERAAHPPQPTVQAVSSTGADEVFTDPVAE